MLVAENKILVITFSCEISTVATIYILYTTVTTVVAALLTIIYYKRGHIIFQHAHSNPVVNLTL